MKKSDKLGSAGLVCGILVVLFAYIAGRGAYEGGFIEPLFLPLSIIALIISLDLIKNASREEMREQMSTLDRVDGE
jgi:uncharacterized membrane protein